MKSAKQLIQPKWYDEYASHRDVIWKELINFNTRLFTLSKIEAFHFVMLFPNYDDRIFWQTISGTLIESMISQAARIMIDKDKNSLTLPNFKSNLLEKWCSPNEKAYIVSLLADVDYDNQVSSIEHKLRIARNKHVAHLDRKSNVKPNPEESANIALSLKAMRSLLDTARALFNVLCFETYHELWLMAYDERTRSDNTTDIDKLLNDVARNSLVLGRPESNLRIWEAYRLKMSRADLEVFNTYRKRLDLPEMF